MAKELADVKAKLASIEQEKQITSRTNKTNNTRPSNYTEVGDTREGNNNTTNNNSTSSKSSSNNTNTTASVRSKCKIPHSVKMASWDAHIGYEIGKAKCMCCKINDILQGGFVCGHVIPESQGGPTTVENLRPICSACNGSMLTNNMKEFALKYYRVEI